MADYIKRIRTENGDMQIDYQALANLPKSDTALSTSGAFADAKITGDQIKSVNTKIDNITNGTTTAPTISATDLKAKNFTLDGSAVKSYDLTMGSVASGKILSTKGAINLAHSHAVIVNDDGTITLGEVSSTGGNFKIADTKAYKDGVSAAINSVTLSSAGWNNGANVVTASNGKSVTVNLPSFSASGGTSFDSSNKTKVFFYTSSVSGPLKTVEVDASSVYASGQTAGVNGVTLSKSWKTGTITVTASNGKNSTATLSKGTESWNDNTCSFPIMDGSTSTELMCSVDATARYNAGASSVTVPNANIVRNADDAYNSSDYSTTVAIKATASNGKYGTQTFTVSGKSAYDAGYSAGNAGGAGSVTLSKSWSGGILTVKASNGKTSTAQISKGTESWNGNLCSFPVMDGGGSTGYTCKVDASARYTAGVNSVTVPNTNITRQAADSYAGGDNHSTIVYIRAQASNGKYGTQSFTVSGESAYNAGYNAGRTSGSGAVTLSKSWSGGILTVKASSGVESTAQISKGTETWDGNKCSFPIMDGQGSTGYTCTVDASDRYTAGANSVTLAGSWSGGVYTVTASNGKVSKGYAGISAVTWDQDTKGYVYLVDNSGNKISSNVTIDASSVYTKGQTAGANSVTLSKSWSGGILSVKASNGQSSTAQLSKGTETWDGNSCSFSIMDGGGSTGYTCKVDASDRFTAGANSVTLSKSWSGGILTVEASNGIATSTAQISKGTESWSGNTCSFPIVDGGGSTGYTCKVDASARYTAGVDSVTALNPEVVSSSHAHSTSKLMAVTIRSNASNGATKDFDTSINAAPVYDYGYSKGKTDGVDSVTVTSITRQAADSYAGGDNHSTTVSIRAQASNGAYNTQSFSVSGASAYAAGYAAGKAAMSLQRSSSGGTYTISLVENASGAKSMTCSYSASKHSYTASSYSPSSHTKTSQYNCLYTASSYTKESHSYTASSISWS